MNIQKTWASKLRNCLYEDSNDLFDVSFKLKRKDGWPKSLKAHKLILSLASPVFKQQFYGSLRPQDGEEVEIKDGTFEIFKDFLTLIYTEEHLEKFSKVDSAESVKDLFDLFYLGEKYQTRTLTNYLYTVLARNITLNKENVVSILETIEEYKVSVERPYFILREHCFIFLDANMGIFFQKGMETGSKVRFNPDSDSKLQTKECIKYKYRKRRNEKGRLFIS